MDNWQSLQEAFQECSIHTERIMYARRKLQGVFPASPEQWQELTDEQIEAMDQLVLRFIKLQDALGLRVFPRLLAYLGEPLEKAPMLDKLNRLEQIDYLTSAEEWQQLRNIRNNLTHEYPNEPENNRRNFNLFFNRVESLIAIYRHLEAKTGVEG